MLVDVAKVPFVPMLRASRKPIGDELGRLDGGTFVPRHAIEHEAWNRSRGARVVLLVDFPKSALP